VAPEFTLHSKAARRSTSIKDAAIGTGRQVISFYQEAPRESSNSLEIKLLPLPAARPPNR
jgi:hypothetical protein